MSNSQQSIWMGVAIIAIRLSITGIIKHSLLGFQNRRVIQARDKGYATDLSVSESFCSS